MFNSDLQKEFCLLQPCSIARERAVMEYITDSRLDANDITIHLSGLEVCIALLFLCFFVGL